MRTFSDFSTFSWTECREDQVGKITCVTVVTTVQSTGQSEFCISQCVELVFGLLVFTTTEVVFLFPTDSKKARTETVYEQKAYEALLFIMNQETER